MKNQILKNITIFGVVTILIISAVFIIAESKITDDSSLTFVYTDNDNLLRYNRMTGLGPAQTAYAKYRQRKDNIIFKTYTYSEKNKIDADLSQPQ
jgi:hypothetical protein